MTSRRLLSGLAAALLSAAAAHAQTLERHALIVGANNGGRDRPRLQYAVADAERVARVLGDLGGVSEAHETVLRDPQASDLLAALDRLKARLTAARAGGRPPARTEVFVYYSGHADERGLLLDDDRVSYRTLRERLDALPADVRIAVLDACSSGAFTRTKGGTRRPPFLVDESAAMTGYAFITSSAASEAAQESDRIRSSFFTHYLVSGFRGAADTSGDGRVTLNEAYQFAFAETLGRTVDTRGGAQHPTYEINLTGAGDVVITDVRQTTARLVLADALEGRAFVRTPSRMLVAELYKPAGREIEIALPPGAYDVKLERGRTTVGAIVTVAADVRAVVGAAQLTPAAPEPTRRRGADIGEVAVQGAYRFTMQSSLWGTHGDALSLGGWRPDITGGAQLSRYLSERLAVTAGFTVYGSGAQVDVIGGFALPLGVQWNPRRGAAAAGRFKPFLSAQLLPITAADSEWSRRYSVGAGVGAGFDLHVSPTFALGLSGAFNAVPGFTRTAGRHDTYHGPELALRTSWTFGRGR